MTRFTAPENKVENNDRSTTVIARQPPTMREPLEIENLSVRLDGFSLEEISFRLHPGQVTGLLGHNGAGKTTTLRLIMGMVRKDTGSIRIGSLDHQKDEKAFKRRIGFVPEESYFYNRMTTGELIDFVKGFHQSWNEETCTHLLDILDLRAEKRIGQLSKGIRMKVNLLLALAYEPDVLLLDEATAGLDPRSRIEILKLVRAAAHEHGRAVLFSTHILHEVEQIADRIIILDHGRVLSDENLNRLRNKEQNSGSWSLEKYYLELIS
jgi:ABC-2 type transport system ATP-binding protein